jgi:hypothetical protein
VKSVALWLIHPVWPTASEIFYFSAFACTQDHERQKVSGLTLYLLTKLVGCSNKPERLTVLQGHCLELSIPVTFYPQHS